MKRLERSIWVAVVLLAMLAIFVGGAEEEKVVPQAEYDGVYVMLERDDVYSLGISYGDHSTGMCDAGDKALDKGRYLFLDKEIRAAVQKANGPIPFTMTARRSDGTIIASQQFQFDGSQKNLYFILTADGRIREEYGHVY